MRIAALSKVTALNAGTNAFVMGGAGVSAFWAGGMSSRGRWRPGWMAREFCLRSKLPIASMTRLSISGAETLATDPAAGLVAAQDRLRDIIAPALRSPLRPTRRHQVAPVVEQLADQQRVRRLPLATLGFGCEMVLQALLDLVPKVTIDDGRMLAFVDNALYERSGRYRSGWRRSCKYGLG